MSDRYLKFFTPEYWNSFFSKKGGVRAFFAKSSRIAVAASRGFNYDDCTTKASALTFYSMLSIVPVLAVAFGIAKGFGFENHLEAELQQKFLEQREVADKLFEFAHQMLLSSQGGIIAGVGIVVLLWTVIKLLGSIESSFNAIWKVKQARSLSRKFSDYLALIIFCPLFFAASSSISVFIMTNIIDFTKSTPMWNTISPLIYFAFHLFPMFFSWLLFTGIYFIMPNAKVPLRYALLAGIVAGTAYQMVQWTYIQFQFGLSSYSAIYGSFAALPLFLIWLNTSWLITLAGAEIAYYAETDQAHVKLYGATRQQSIDGRVLGLEIMQRCVQAFRHGDLPPTEYILSEKTGIPVVEIRVLIHSLLRAGLLVEVTWKDGSSGYYQPGRSIETITVKSICDALDITRQIRYIMVHNPEIDKFVEILKEFDVLLENAEINRKFIWDI
jgi:membrane protein